MATARVKARDSGSELSFPEADPPDTDQHDEANESADDGDTPVVESPARVLTRKKNAKLLNILQQETEDDQLSTSSSARRVSNARQEIESEKIIDKAREYQQELFERAKDENVIAVLDTGSGKTLIAAMLIRHILDQQVLVEAAGKSPQFVFFLAHR